MAELSLAPSQAPSVAVARLVLTDRQWRSESLLGYCLALEHARILGPDSQQAAAYVARTLDNCRVGAVDVRAYFSAVVRHLRWLRGLPTGGGLR